MKCMQSLINRLTNMQAFERFQVQAKKQEEKLMSMAGVEIAKTKKLNRLRDDLREVNKKYEVNKSEFKTNVCLNEQFKGSFIDSTAKE